MCKCSHASLSLPTTYKMPLLNERAFKKTIPVALLIFFIVLMNLVMIFHYLLPNNDPRLEPPVQHNRSDFPPYEPPYYGLKLVRPKEKKFTSQAIEDHLDALASTMKDKDLYTLLQNCLPNTLDTTVEWVSSDKRDPRTFLITGDSKHVNVTACNT